MPDFDSLRVIALPLVEVAVLLLVEVAVLLLVEVVDSPVEAVVLLSHLWAKADQLSRFAFHQQASVL